MSRQYWKATPTPNTRAGLLLVVNKGDRTLSLVDPESGRQLAAIDPSSWKVEMLIDVGAGADGLGWSATDPLNLVQK